jgi:arylsulfatase A-like enzyme
MLRPLALSTLLIVTLACQRESRQSEAPPAADLTGKNLIVITLGTSRQDHFSCYGDPAFRGSTPHIDDLAADGALFLNGFSQTNVTNPSHVAIFTGLYALDLEVMNNGVPFPVTETGIDSLPAAFRRANYRTVAFPAIPHLAALNVPGFDESAPSQRELTAGENVDLFLAWIERDATGPFFAWLHLFDPHAPYEPPEQYQAKLYIGDPTQGEGAKLSTIARFETAPPIVQEQFAEVRDRAYPKAMYRGEIQYTDDQIGRLLSELKERGGGTKTPPSSWSAITAKASANTRSTTTTRRSTRIRCGFRSCSAFRDSRAASASPNPSAISTWFRHWPSCSI